MMVFIPLSFTFWRGIIWIPEMRGKGVQEIFLFLVYNCLPCFLPMLVPNWSNFLINFGSNFGSLFWGLGVLWVSFGSLLGPLDSLLGGPKNENMVNVPRENHFLWKCCFLTLWSSWWSSWVHLGPLGPLWSQTGFQHEFQHLSTKCLTNCVKIV